MPYRRDVDLRPYLHDNLDFETTYRFKRVAKKGEKLTKKQDLKKDYCNH